MSSSHTYRAWCKATRNEQTTPRYSHHWVNAKRTWFKIFEDRIECGSWIIPKEDIQKVIAYRTKQMFIPVMVLQITTQQGRYHFGFNPWSNPVSHLQLPVEEQTVRLKYSAFSIVLRVLICGFLGYLLWAEFFKWIGNMSLRKSRSNIRSNSFNLLDQATRPRVVILDKSSIHMIKIDRDTACAL